MSSPKATRIEDTFTSKRVTVRTTRSFDEVTARLYNSIGTPANAGWPSIVAYLEGPSPTKEGFVATAKQYIGPELFMLFGKSIIVSGHPCMVLPRVEELRELFWETP